MNHGFVEPSTLTRGEPVIEYDPHYSQYYYYYIVKYDYNCVHLVHGAKISEKLAFTIDIIIFHTCSPCISSKRPSVVMSCLILLRSLKPES